MARQRRRRGGGTPPSTPRHDAGRTPPPAGNRPPEAKETRGAPHHNRRPGPKPDHGQRFRRQGQGDRRPAPSPAGPMASMIPNTVLFRDVTAIDFQRDWIFRGDVLVAHGVIQEVGRNLRAPADAEILPGHRRLLIPGLVDANARLTADALPGFNRRPLDPKGRDAWLHRTNAALDERSLICTAFAGAIDALRAGTTCLLDAHESPNFIDGSLVRLKDVLLTLGIRSILGYAVREAEGAGSLDSQLAVSRAAAAFGGGETLRMAIATSRLDEVSEAALQTLGELRQKHETPFIGQLGRHEDEAQNLQSRFGKSGTERLLQYGLLGPTAAIRVGGYLLPEDEARLLQSGATLVHTPRSDLLAARPRLSLSRVLGKTTLGTAEVEAHLLRELRMASDLAAGAREELSNQDLVGLVIRGQELASKIFGMSLGRIEAGAAADLVLVEYDPAYPITPATLAHHLLRGIGSARVLATMVSGRFLVRNGEITTLDAKELYEVLRRGAGELHERLFGEPYPGLSEWEKNEAREPARQSHPQESPEAEAESAAEAEDARDEEASGDDTEETSSAEEDRFDDRGSESPSTFDDLEDEEDDYDDEDDDDDEEDEDDEDEEDFEAEAQRIADGHDERRSPNVLATDDEEDDEDDADEDDLDEDDELDDDDLDDEDDDDLEDDELDEDDEAADSDADARFGDDDDDDLEDDEEDFEDDEDEDGESPPSPEGRPNARGKAPEGPRGEGRRRTRRGDDGPFGQGIYE